MTSVLLSWYYYQLKSTDFTVMSINLADKLVNKQLVILLIFVNKEHFVNAVTMEKVSHVDKMRMQTMREQGFEAKARIRAYTGTNNGN